MMCANEVGHGGRDESIDGGMGGDGVSDLRGRDGTIEFGVVVLQEAAIGLRIKAELSGIQRCSRAAEALEIAAFDECSGVLPL